MDEKTKIRAAILGYGRNGSTMHADAIEKSDDFELTHVCDIDSEALDRAKRRFGCETYDDYRQMAKEKDIDLVVIVTRSSQHCEMACECLGAGKNVLVTKPWATNAGQAEKMIAAANESGSMLLPWLPARWGADLVRLRELVGSGVIGKVFRVKRSHQIFSVRHDWQTQKEYGGGYLLNWGPHLIDQPIQLAGSPVKSVYAELRQVINPNDGEDDFFAVMKTQDGTTLISEHSVSAPKLPDWVIQGDRGTIFVEGNKIEIHKANPVESKNAAGYGTSFEFDTYIDEKTLGYGDLYGNTDRIYSHIAEALRGQAPYCVTPESALCLTRVLDAVRSSGETGQVVYL